MPPERPNILDLLPSHHVLLDRHHQRLVELMGIATCAGLDPTDMAFIVADVAGDFGMYCVTEGAGLEFLVADDNGAGMVVPIDINGLTQLAANLVPEALGAVATRPAGTSPILVVDGDDEPAVVLVAIRSLGARPRS